MQIGIPETPLVPPLPTQSGDASHNAVASIVNMYAGILGDNKRALQLAHAQLDIAREAIKAKDAQLGELKAKLAEVTAKLGSGED